MRRFEEVCDKIGFGDRLPEPALSGVGNPRSWAMFAASVGSSPLRSCVSSDLSAAYVTEYSLDMDESSLGRVGRSFLNSEALLRGGWNTCDLDIWRGSMATELSAIAVD
jgi:hypothetical protein